MGSLSRIMKIPCTLKLDNAPAKVLLSNMGREDIRAREIAESGAVTLESCEALVLLLG